MMSFQNVGPCAHRATLSSRFFVLATFLVALVLTVALYVAFKLTAFALVPATLLRCRTVLLRIACRAFVDYHLKQYTEGIKAEQGLLGESADFTDCAEN